MHGHSWRMWEYKGRVHLVSFLFESKSRDLKLKKKCIYIYICCFWVLFHGLNALNLSSFQTLKCNTFALLRCQFEFTFQLVSHSVRDPEITTCRAIRAWNMPDSKLDHSLYLLQQFLTLLYLDRLLPNCIAIYKLINCVSHGN